MKSLSVLFPLFRDYRLNLASNASLNALGAILSLFSFLSVVPFLRILFGGVTTHADDIPGRIGEWFDNYVVGVGTTHALLMVCISVVVLAVLKNLVSYLAMYSLATIRTGVSRDLRNNMYKRVLGQTMGWFTNSRKGDVLSRLTVDLNEVEVSIVGSVEVMFKSPLIVFISIAALFALSWELTIFALVFLPVSGVLISRIAKKLKHSALKGKEELGSLVNILEETLSGVRIIKAFGVEGVFTKRFSKRNESHFQAVRKMYRREYLSSPVSEVISLTVMAILLGYGGHIVLDGTTGLTGDWFIGYLVVFSQIIPPARAFSDGWFRINKGVASLDRLEEMLETSNSVPEAPANAKPLEDFRTAISFKNVSYSYGDQKVISSLSLNIKKGEVVALVGASGSGKTTLSNLLIRFDDPTDGSIEVDGRDLRSIPIASWRDKLGVVTQESILFHGTITSNISIGDEEVDEKKLQSAAEDAQVLEFASKMPDGLQTAVGDGGGKLSGGQRQRVALARALYRDPSILVLDEATSALDAESEHAVQTALDAAMENRTVLVIAHRLSTVSKADRIILLSEGKILEEGTHDELISKNGSYSKLVSLQSFTS
ncbi:MAG TPA: ABC transporter ATP-binding protein [Flavobacteriales bacterium]|nr:ABC transporter ATP-binding protein [Flavobacteriales bacterium]HIO58945.1 ABC transporter ATP-binding protein [Flavobacteriales bacterium]